MIEFIINNFLTIACALFALAALINVSPNRYQSVIHFFSTFLSSTASLVGLTFVATYLLNFTQIEYTPLTFDKFLSFFDISFTVNRISVIFLGILFFVTFTSTLFGYSYIKHFFGKYRPGILAFSYNLFILSMIMVLMSQTIFSFIFSWEMMSITSFFLIIFENNKAEKVRAGILYFIFTQIGVLFIISALILLGIAANSQYFADFMQVGENIKIISSILLLIGLGAKAGIIPLHIWLPEAHPAAPSHASAVISAVMLKVAIYVMIEFFVFYIYLSSPFLGILLIVFGILTAVLGALYAFVVRDIKRLVAYSSIDNIGILVTLLGFTLYFSYLAADEYQKNNFTQTVLSFQTLAQLSFVTLFFHAINHAIYKSALFQSTGVIVNTYKTRILDELGGIAKKLPYFSALFILFAIALSGLPPFNGFASEWMAVQNAIGGVIASDSTNLISKFLFIGAGLGLIFTGAVTAGAFAKAIGVGLLGMNRMNKEDITEEKKHIGFTIYASLTISALAVLVLSVFSFHIVGSLSSIVIGKDQYDQDYLTTSINGSIINPVSSGNISNYTIGLFILITMVLVYAFLKLWKTRVKYYKTWDCGRDVNSRMQYTSIAFSDNVRMTFKSILFPRKNKTLVTNDDYKYSEYIPEEINYSENYLRVYNKFIYDPIMKSVLWFGNTIKRVQTGKIATYLIYIISVLIVFLIIAVNV